jgi:hypothetical protein
MKKADPRKARPDARKLDQEKSSAKTKRQERFSEAVQRVMQTHDATFRKLAKS